MIGSYWRHHKRGGIYTVVGDMTLNAIHAVEGDTLVLAGYSASNPSEVTTQFRLYRADAVKEFELFKLAFKIDFQLQCKDPIMRGCDMILYEGQDSRRWARPRFEFVDGRFTKIQS